jgi:glycosyltransferase involved in cell wall biosynthesis
MKSSMCDIIHAHWTYEFAAAALDSGIPCLVTAHDSPFVILKQFVATRFAPFWTFRTLFGVSVIRRAPAMTTVSPYCRAHINKTIHPHCNISVVPNGVEPHVCERGERRINTGQPGGPPVIASVMDGFSRRKNAENALRAFGAFRQECPDAKYLIYGTCFAEGEEAHTWAVASGLADGVEFRGRTPQDVMFPELLERAHMFLHPSVEESFGMAPLEAMALGIPVIGGRDSGGVPYVLDGGNAGVLVDVRSPAAIAEALKSLWRDPARRGHLARQGWDRAKSTFSLNKMVDAYEAEYGRLIRN